LDFHGKFCFTEIALDFPEKLNNRTIKENTNLVSFGLKLFFMELDHLRLRYIQDFITELKMKY